MKTIFESGKAIKFSEVDDYREGCNPDTSQSFIVDIQFSANSIKELLANIMEYYDVTTNDVFLNSCDTEGRLDIGIMENEEGQKATEREITLWKEGKKKLWYSVYTYNITKNIIETVAI